MEGDTEGAFYFSFQCFHDNSISNQVKCGIKSEEISCKSKVVYFLSVPSTAQSASISTHCATSAKILFFSNCFKYFVQSSSKRAEVRFLQCNHFIPSTTERYFFAISPKGLRGSNPLQDAFASRPCRHKPPSICLTKRKKGSQASAPSSS